MLSNNENVFLEMFCTFTKSKKLKSFFPLWLQAAFRCIMFPLLKEDTKNQAVTLRELRKSSSKAGERDRKTTSIRTWW